VGNFHFAFLASETWVRALMRPEISKLPRIHKLFGGLHFRPGPTKMGGLGRGKSHNARLIPDDGH
jgi:hypothetical protein